MKNITEFAAFASNLFEPVLVVDPSSQAFHYINPSAAELFGFEEDLESYTLFDVIADASIRLSNIKSTIANEEKWSGHDIQLLVKGGDKVASNINAISVEVDGEPMIAFMVENRSTQDLADLGQEVRKIAHDIRGALTTTQLVCERLSGHEDETVSRASEILARSLNRVFQMCLQILNVGKVKKQMPQSVEFYLSDLISDLNASLIGPDQDYMIRLNASEEISIEADYNQIYRALLNLSRNARNAGATQITISGENSDEGTQITLSDDGPGIPEDTIPNLFKHKTLYRGSGTGLGLMITHEIITNHNGSIELVRNDAQGAMFSIYLPSEYHEESEAA
ncbi:MAG: ATP-binding protein [Litorimonas sp.]